MNHDKIQNDKQIFEMENGKIFDGFAIVRLCNDVDLVTEAQLSRQ